MPFKGILHWALMQIRVKKRPTGPEILVVHFEPSHSPDHMKNFYLLNLFPFFYPPLKTAGNPTLVRWFSYSLNHYLSRISRLAMFHLKAPLGPSCSRNPTHSGSFRASREPTPLGSCQIRTGHCLPRRVIGQNSLLPIQPSGCAAPSLQGFGVSFADDVLPWRKKKNTLPSLVDLFIIAI